MKNIAVRKMQDYIKAHLQEQITLQQLSKVSGYSPRIIDI
ncbi:MAG: helix-turn-helix transcriptional regulator [Clostridia bacterium]|nr:helix-turn-helix transcriptional regulator [Clostridia bacterium]